MKTRIDPRFRDEAERTQFRFACEHCVHFDAASETCTMGFPAAPRLVARNAASLELCKSFELL